MRWAKSEYILKGVFLGLLLFVSLQKNLDWEATGRETLKRQRRGLLPETPVRPGEEPNGD